MFEPISFRVNGLPKGQPRPRAFAMKGAGIRMYDPGTAEGWKGQVAEAARDLLPAEPIAVPIYLYLVFHMPRPKAHTKPDGRLRDTAPVFHLGKPDMDNLAKAVMDALTVLRMWSDDALVCDLHCRKIYDTGAGPGCWVTIKDAIKY